jgi:hypothetical protein
MDRRSERPPRWTAPRSECTRRNCWAGKAPTATGRLGVVPVRSPVAGLCRGPRWRVGWRSVRGRHLRTRSGTNESDALCVSESVAQQRQIAPRWRRQSSSADVTRATTSAWLSRDSAQPCCSQWSVGGCRRRCTHPANGGKVIAPSTPHLRCPPRTALTAQPKSGYRWIEAKIS